MIFNYGWKEWFKIAMTGVKKKIIKCKQNNVNTFIGADFVNVK